MDETENSAVDVVEAADRALHRIERTARHAEECWPIVITGMYELRQRAMRATRTNDIESGRYRAEFNRLRGMHRHLAKMSPSEASACCWCAEHPDLAEAARTGMNTHHGQAPTPYGVYQRAQRIARAKAAAEKANSRESREALKAAAAEAEQEIYDTAEERDRLAMRAHEEKEKADRIKEEAQQKLEKLQAELIKVKAEHPAVAEVEAAAREEREQARQIEGELRAENAKLRAVIAELRALLAEKGEAPPDTPKPKAGRRLGPPKVIVPVIEALLAQGYSLREISGRGMNEGQATASLLRAGRLKLTDERLKRLKSYAARMGVAS